MASSMTYKPALGIEVNLSKEDLDAIASGSTVSALLENDAAVVRVQMCSKPEKASQAELFNKTEFSEVE